MNVSERFLNYEKSILYFIENNFTLVDEKNNTHSNRIFYLSNTSNNFKFNILF